MQNTMAIDATKYDIRALWTGLKAEHTSADAGILEEGEGYPLDPPDNRSGWILVRCELHLPKKGEDPDKYWTLWIREKKQVRKARKRAKAASSKKTPATKTSKKKAAATPATSKKKAATAQTEPKKAASKPSAETPTPEPADPEVTVN